MTIYQTENQTPLPEYEVTASWKTKVRAQSKEDAIEKAMDKYEDYLDWEAEPVTENQENVQENVCCPYLGILPCGTTKEHQHPVCYAKGHPLITSSHTKEFCIAPESQNQKCPHYQTTT